VAEVICGPFPVPGYFRQIYGIAVARDYTAAVWLAIDDERDVGYIHSELCLSGAAPPAVFVQGVRARGSWIPGIALANEEILGAYRRLGLKLSVLNNHEAGICEARSRLASGRLRVFRTCQRWIEEYDGSTSGPLFAATACAVSGLTDAALRPRELWDRTMIGAKPEPRHRADYDPFRKLYPPHAPLRQRR
jgi:hypothetical protein